jgi:hypothetical protein
MSPHSASKNTFDFIGPDPQIRRGSVEPMAIKKIIAIMQGTLDQASVIEMHYTPPFFWTCREMQARITFLSCINHVDNVQSIITVTLWPESMCIDAKRPQYN